MYSNQCSNFDNLKKFSILLVLTQIFSSLQKGCENYANFYNKLVGGLGLELLSHNHNHNHKFIYSWFVSS